MQMNPIRPLICGHDKTEGIAKVALGQLAFSVNHFGGKSVNFLNDPVSDELLSFGPFCARVLLENSCAALVGRMDVFRMLYLSEFQSQSEYELGKRARSAFSWTGDVFPEDKGSQSLWSIEHDVPKISRALFSRHFEHIYWKPAVESMLNFMSGQRAEPELADILAIDADNFISISKGRSAQLYSTLSKGVHWEFFTSALLFDEITVKSAIRDTCVLISHLGLVSHFIPTAYASLDPNDAVDTYILFRKLVP